MKYGKLTQNREYFFALWKSPEILLFTVMLFMLGRIFKYCTALWLLRSPKSRTTETHWFRSASGQFHRQLHCCFKSWHWTARQIKKSMYHAQGNTSPRPEETEKNASSYHHKKINNPVWKDNGVLIGNKPILDNNYSGTKWGSDSASGCAVQR